MSPDERRVERVMKGYQALIDMGYLVPMRDADGQPVIRRGEVVYERTKNPEILARFKACDEEGIR